MDTEPDVIIIRGVEYRKDFHHFYQDGNVLFLVEGTAYKVLASMMARQSSIMKDMFDMPQELGGETDPVIQLDDKKVVFLLLLDFISPLAPPQQYSALLLEEMFDLLVITQKYAADHIHDSLLVLCDSLLPHSIPTLSKLTSFDLDDAYRLILSARTVAGLEKYLPLAYYAIATTETSDQIPKLNELSVETRLAISTGGLNLLKKTVSRFRDSDAEVGMLTDEFICASTGKPCWRSEYRNPDTILEGWFDPVLHPLEELYLRVRGENTVRPKDMCSGACVDRENTEKELIQRLYDDLPGLFGLKKST